MTFTPPADFKGDFLTPENPKFKTFALERQWNQSRPDRFPDVIACVADVDDVISVVNYAREHGLRVSVRGGGHNWACNALRRGGMLIDLARLNRVVSIDVENRIAITEPIVSNREMQQHLSSLGLAYPTGHCPEVKMSGYLLSGGMSWNHGVWGPGVGSVEAIEMVLPDGRLVEASRTENADLFWAARGSGAGFFGVAVRYHLRLYESPEIYCSLYYYPIRDAVRIAEWLGPLADEMSPNVELSLFMIDAPHELRDQCLADNGKCSLVTATVFAKSRSEAEDAVRCLEECPVKDRVLSRTFAAESNFQGLSDASGSLWPSGLRALVDASFSDEKLSSLVDATLEDFIACPSTKTVYMFAVYTGGHAPALPSDAAFSVTGKLYGGPWTMWENAADDQLNLEWHEALMSKLKPFLHSRYLSESSTQLHPEYIEEAFSKEHLQRIEELRQVYDPGRLFFGFYDSL